MGVSIEFRGILVCHTKSDVVEEIVLPNAETNPDWVKGTSPWKHPKNNGEALKHYARIYIRHSNGTVEHLPFIAKNARIGNGNERAVVSDSSTYDHFARLKGVLPDTVLRYPGNSIAVRINVHEKAEVKVGTDAAHPFDFNGQLLDYLSFKLDFDATEVSVSGVKGGTLQLDESDRVIVYNYEIEEPSIDELLKEDMTLCTDDVMTDVDFRWAYSLLESTNGGAWPPAILPAPTFDCLAYKKKLAESKGIKIAAEIPDIFTPRVSTCFPAFWQG